ncbi:MAG: HNH endonuclease [Gammaproteobacteria bacterium]|nr:HNH endonuclease [Gammaproteobacteria bacterium]
MAVAGALRENKIYYEPNFLERYKSIFEVVKTVTDHANPYFPFFHLRSEDFWHLKAREGKESVVQALPTARSRKHITENVDHVCLDEELFQLLQDTNNATIFKETIISHWFPEKRQAFERFYQSELPEMNYENNLRGLVEQKDAKLSPTDYDKILRDRAFRKVIIEAYDYRCAASGWRIITPDDKVLVEAAHIVPFSKTHDDDPRNGIALTPTYHWAFDNRLIAPGTDLKWHVTKDLDPRIRDYEGLIGLEGKEILLPKNKKYWPKKESLEWAIANLNKLINPKLII